MTSRHLAQHYHTLTAWERMPLIVAAQSRGDEPEADRLARSAAQSDFRLPNYWGLAEGLDGLVKLYLIDQLDLAALIWRATFLLEQEALPGNRAAQRPWRERLAKAMRLLAYQFVIQAEGWKQLGAELHVDLMALVRLLPGAETVEQMEKAAQRIAFSQAEALAYVRESDERRQLEQAKAGEPASEERVVTAADVTRSMRAYLQSRLDAWC